MQNAEIKSNMEAIAMKFLSQTESFKSNNQHSLSTIKDIETLGKMTSTTIHSRGRSKVLSIISNNTIIAEYNFDYFNNKKVLFKIPSKVIEDCDDVSWEEDIEIVNKEENKVNGNSNSNVDNNNDDDAEELLEEVLNEESFGFNHEDVFRLISELYSPLIKLFTSIDDFLNSIQPNLQKIDKWLNKANPFIHLTKLKTEFFDQTLYEIIFIGYVIFFYQINTNTNNDIQITISRDDFEIMFRLLSECLDSLYENIILIISYNSSNKQQSKVFSFEELCLQYVKEYYKINFKPSREQIFSKIKDNLTGIKESFGTITEIVINSIYQNVNNDILSSFTANFVEEINYFEKLILVLKKDKEVSLNELKSAVRAQYNKFISIIQQTNIPTPFLPPIDSKRYKYTLVLDLDETLVHYVEEEERAYVQVRPHAEEFLIEMGKHFELVIFTAAAEDYADIVIAELDKSKSVSHRLYRKHTLKQKGIYLKDLTKLGRNLNTMCIIDNSKENYDLQPDNGLHISSFVGDQKDNELLLLSNDLMKIPDSKNKIHYDIRPILKTIRESMAQRYQLLEKNNEGKSVI